jgi:hypothetical protein
VNSFARKELSMKWTLSFVTPALAILLAGCSSDAADGFAGSCTYARQHFVTSTQTRVTTNICAEYSGITMQAAQRCSSESSGTYSQNNCSTAGLYGRCTVVEMTAYGTATTTFFYPTTWSSSSADAQDDCRYVLRGIYSGS